MKKNFRESVHNSNYSIKAKVNCKCDGIIVYDGDAKDNKFDALEASKLNTHTYLCSKM